MAQELWLTEKQLTQLHQLGTSFVARSGMEEAVSAGVMRGRPFGGVSIAWSPDLNHVITPLPNYKHKRVVAVELHSTNKSIILISVYMPFFDSNNRASCMAETMDSIAMVGLIINDHPQHLIVIGGDLNCELLGNSPFDPMWQDLRSKYQLAYCRDLFGSPGYTYHHASLGHKKLNDHFIVSQSLLNDGITTDYKILDEGENISDHLPITMAISIEIRPEESDLNPGQNEPTLKWSKLTPSDIDSYSNSLSSSLYGYNTASLNVCQEYHCDSIICKQMIESDYDNIISCIRLSDSKLPRHKRGVEKNWWNTQLTELKHQSIDIHRLWISEGRPRNGPTNQERIRVRAAYKIAIKTAQLAPKQEAWNKLHTAMVENETNDFWKSWKSLYGTNKSKPAPVINGCSSKASIAEEFRKNFQSNSEPNNRHKVEELNSQFDKDYDEFNKTHDDNCNCKDYSFTIQNIFDAIGCMKSGKCADEDGISPEHFFHAPFILLHRLTTLFNNMLRHSFVPDKFKLGFMIPLIKDNRGNHGDVSNYRGITISPTISKVFEHALKDIFADHFSTSFSQFGFKRRSSTVDALFALKQTINYYTENKSRVYCSFLDASKAFDRVVHSGLFIKLIQRNVPKVFLDILISMHCGLYCRVKWEGCYSGWLHLKAGVRQGGVISPDLYCIYVDGLINILQSLDIGCYVKNVFAAAIFYADDMAVLSPSIKGLQRLLDVCAEYCRDWDIKLNSKKTKNIFFGKGKTPNFQLKLDGSSIPWETNCIYLGVMLQCAAKFDCCMKETLRKFYASLNSIIRVDGRSDDMVMLRLLEAHSLPILTYAIETIEIANRDDRRQLRVAYNAIYRKMFGYSYRESVTLLQHTLGRMTWEELLEKRRSDFISRCRRNSPNPLIQIFCQCD